jgi:Trk-type K+ transport system membrane component
MFVPQNQQQFRGSNADIQMFYSGAKNTATTQVFQPHGWVKPVGVSHVYMMLIGGGSSSSTTNGGAGGAVTVWYGAAQHVPDNLLINVGGATNATQGKHTTVSYRGSSLIELLRADGADTAAAGGAAFPANFFTASGFFQSVAGPNGNAAPTTTFLTGGASSGAINGQYGYTTNSNAGQGIFLLQPIIVGVGFSGGGTTGVSAIGCGGDQAFGGPGFALIASW